MGRQAWGRTDAEQRLKVAHRLLQSTYREADLGNLTDPLAEAVYILISRQTREAIYQAVFATLRSRYSMWVSLSSADYLELEEMLRPAGFQRQRADQILGLLNVVGEENRRRGVGPYASDPGDLTLDFLREMDDAACESFLRSLPGVGPKSARCILSYSLDRPAFAVDTHVERVLARLGVIRREQSKLNHDEYQRLVPSHARRRLHVNLVHHGRASCRANHPGCASCVLAPICPQEASA